VLIEPDRLAAVYPEHGCGCRIFCTRISRRFALTKKFARRFVMHAAVPMRAFDRYVEHPALTRGPAAIARNTEKNNAKDHFDNSRFGPAGQLAGPGRFGLRASSCPKGISGAGDSEPVVPQLQRLHPASANACLVNACRRTRLVTQCPRRGALAARGSLKRQPWRAPAASRPAFASDMPCESCLLKDIS
jgi:hypothetical protein